MLAVFPSNTKDQIEEIINMIGRDVTFYLVSTYDECQVCSLDPITGNSTDSYCPSCSGEYYIPNYSGWTVKSHVTWGRSEDRAWETGGMIDNGECTVKFIYSGWMDDIIFNSDYVIVDEREMDFLRITMRGVPEKNRVIVHLKEKERQ